jgi:UDP-N-acetylmuramate--alanine ligase
MSLSGLEEYKKVHFIGIGGIGISAVARLMILNGKVVTGSDASDSLAVFELKKLGAKISDGHAAKNISKDVDLVIYTIAISKDNPEFLQAKRLKVKAISYPESLGLISKDMFTIAVSGTHGKTTTTAMIGKMLIDAGFDPTIIVGSFLKEKKSNLVVGKSKYLVVEACEYRRSFLNINPNILVITNIDNDHLDYYKNISNIQSAFTEMAYKLKGGGVLVCSSKEKNVGKVIKFTRSEPKIVLKDYSKEANVPKLLVFGKHNTKNAQAALSVARVLGVDEIVAKKSLAGFSGTWRRTEFRGYLKPGVLVYDDYGHHPTEINATMTALRESIKDHGRLFVVFQPHLYSRTKTLFKDFVKVLSAADFVCVMPIYAAREKNDKSINSQMLVDSVLKKGVDATCLDKPEDIFNVLKAKTEKGDIVLTIGAGSIAELPGILVKK